MIKERDRLEKIHDMDASVVCELLEEGKNLVFLTIGDPSIYSTYMYLHKRILKMGYEAEMVPGIPSFCAAASRINDSLAEKEEQLHIIPASYGIGKALELSGTKIFMKAGRKLPELKRRLQGRSEKVIMIENCGMENEAVYQGTECIPEDLITVRGQNKLKEADVVIYAGSLVNPALLKMCREECEIYNSAEMTLEEVMEVMIKGESSGKKVVRLHTGDPCLYGAIKEQMDELDRRKIPFEDCPGVSSFCGAAAALKAEYTLPGISQSVVITRMAGRTPVPEKESIRSFAAHQATMVLFLSTGMLEKLSEELVAGGYQEETPAAIVYKATWPEEKVMHCTVGTLAETAEREKVTKTALIVVGNVLNTEYERSKLYDPAFTTEFRKGKEV